MQTYRYNSALRRALLVDIEAARELMFQVGLNVKSHLYKTSGFLLRLMSQTHWIVDFYFSIQRLL